MLAGTDRVQIDAFAIPTRSDVNIDRLTVAQSHRKYLVQSSYIIDGHVNGRIQTMAAVPGFPSRPFGASSAIPAQTLSQQPTRGRFDKDRVQSQASQWEELTDEQKEEINEAVSRLCSEKEATVIEADSKSLICSTSTRTSSSIITNSK